MKLIKLSSLILFITFLACQPEKNLLVLNSPSGNLKVTVTIEEGKVFYQLFSKTDTSETLIIKPSPRWD